MHFRSLTRGRQTAQPWRSRRPARAVAALLAAALPASLAVASPAAAASPAAPPPVTVLTPGANNGNGDIFISPFGDTSSYANGAEIINNTPVMLIWFHPVPSGQEAADFRTQTYRGHPVLTWWQGTGLGGLSSGTDYIYNDHYQQIATVQAGNGLLRGRARVPHHPLEHRARPRLRDRHGQPDLHRRGRRIRRSSTGSSRRSTSAPGGSCSSGTAPTTSRTARASSRSPPRPSHPVGLVPRQRGAPGHRRQPADRRPGHLDDLQGEPAHREDHLAAGRQGTASFAIKAAPGQVLDSAGEDVRMAARPGGARPRQVQLL